jgi:hypothetical protein
VQPPDWRIYITPALVLASVFIAYLAMRNARAVARQRATLDLIEKVESGEHYRHIVHAFSELRRGPGFGDIMNPTTKEAKELRRCVNDYLNHYELVAIGILEGILDEGFYKDWMRGPYVRDWNAAADWIQRERWKRTDSGGWTYYEKVFQNYQTVARRWSNEAIQLNKAYSGPPSDAEAGGPSSDPIPPDVPEDKRDGDPQEKGAAEAAPVVDASTPKGDET